MEKRSKKKRRSFFAAAVCLAVLAYLLVTGISIWNYADVDEKRHSDVAIVLGAGIDGDEPSPVFRERINHGIWLYKNGYVEYIIFTGGFGEGNPVSDAYVAKQYAISQGVPENAIFIEQVSTITEENLEQAKIIMEENQWDSAILVSDPLHMKRAMLMAGDYGICACSSPTPTSRYLTLKTKIPFLLREEFFYIGYSIVRLFR